ncbi:MAG: hypothetical protein JW731_07455 [Bacteroidales bacterium]|nr:hypothetical protein [Bacteroidales bacterium]
MKVCLKNCAAFLLFAVILTSTAYSQERPKFLTVTTVHGNVGMKDMSMDDWVKTEKMYVDNVIKKNEYIMTFLVLVHYFTEDNTEVKLISGYSSWENIEKAATRTEELEKAAWPDEKDRKAFFKKESAFYTGMHSDEIYSTLEGAKMMQEKSTEPMVYYVRKMHTAWPENGSEEEITGMVKEYNENVIFKNKYIKAYYPSRHTWGSDSRDLIQAFVVESLCDVENALKENDELAKAHWPDESKRKEFFDKMNMYSSGWHGDFIYRSVPELSKYVQ